MIKYIVYWIISYNTATYDLYDQDYYGFPTYLVTTEKSVEQKQKEFDDLDSAVRFMIDLKEAKKLYDDPDIISLDNAYSKSIDTIWIDNRDKPNPFNRGNKFKL